MSGGSAQHVNAFGTVAILTDSLESIPGVLKRLQIRAQVENTGCEGCGISLAVYTVHCTAVRMEPNKLWRDILQLRIFNYGVNQCCARIRIFLGLLDQDQDH
jgi:hypothetical protein